MSNAVSSVISDYATGLDEVQTEHNVDDRRYVRLHKSPWSQLEEGADPEEATRAENLVISIVACLARVQYKLQVCTTHAVSRRCMRAFFLFFSFTTDLHPDVCVNDGLFLHP